MNNTTTGTAPRAVRIFGREPAVLLGLVEAAIALGVLLFGHRLGVDEAFVVVAMAVVSALVGVYTAIATRDDLLGYATGAAKALLGLGAYFGFDLDLQTQAAVVAFVAAFVGFWQRTQTSPVAAPIDPSPQQVTGSPVDVNTGEVAPVEHVAGGDSARAGAWPPVTG